VIGAPGKGIDQQLVWSIQGAANIELHQVLAGQPLAEKIAAAAFHRCFKGIGVEEFTETFRELDAAREIRKRCFRALLFGVDPTPRLRAVLVFQPAIRVRDHSAAVSVFDRIDSRGGWTVRCGRMLLRACKIGNLQAYSEKKRCLEQPSRCSDLVSVGAQNIVRSRLHDFSLGFREDG